MSVRVFNYSVIVIFILLSSCDRINFLTVSGSIAYDGNKGWVFMKIVRDPLHPISDAECKVDSFYSISYQDSMQAYYREVSTISSRSTHTIEINTENYSPITGKTTVPSNFNVINLNTFISVGDSLPVSWGLADGVSPPEEWYITLSHNNTEYFSTSIPPDSESIIINGNDFPVAGIYELRIYGIIYGNLNNVNSGSDFAGINQRTFSIIIKE